MGGFAPNAAVVVFEPCHTGKGQNSFFFEIALPFSIPLQPTYPDKKKIFQNGTYLKIKIVIPLRRF